MKKMFCFLLIAFLALMTNAQIVGKSLSELTDFMGDPDWSIDHSGVFHMVYFEAPMHNTIIVYNNVNDVVIMQITPVTDREKRYWIRSLNRDFSKVGDHWINAEANIKYYFDKNNFICVLIEQ